MYKAMACAYTLKDLNYTTFLRQFLDASDSRMEQSLPAMVAGVYFVHEITRQIAWFKS